MRAARPALALAVALASTLPAGAAEPRLELEFPRLSGVYSDLSPELVPVANGALAIRLRSPSNRLELFESGLRLRPLAGRVHRVAGSARFEGEADLEADVEVAGFGSRLEDRVTVPRQTVALEGKVEIETLPAGYRVTVLEAPPEAQVAIESRLGGRLVELCRGMIFVPWPGGCDAVEQSFRSARLPLPEPGSSYIVDHDLLTPAERQAIDRYLGRTRSRAR